VCTVSWLPGPGGYLLCFNRDENRARRIGVAPTLREIEGLQVLAPTDADAGGTWIGVNGAGLSLGVANLYGQDVPAPVDPISRGRLVLDLLRYRRIEEVTDALKRVPLERYRPFTLIGAEPGAAARLWSWNGRTITAESRREPGLLVASSAVDQAVAVAARRALFQEAEAEGPLTPDRLTALHSSHRPERGGRSICMHRVDASTVSLTRIEVTTDRIAIAYAAGPPCHTTLGPPLVALRQSVRAGV
jgi:uncharacterized protein with NRDE domain